MSYYRYALRCPYCKKIYANEYYQAVYNLSRYSTSLCPKCGEERGSFERVIVKPKLFGLLGWEVKEENDNSSES